MICKLDASFLRLECVVYGLFLFPGLDNGSAPNRKATANAVAFSASPAQ
jgi:hypothetical protein